jgi:hypothetical protein
LLALVLGVVLGVIVALTLTQMPAQAASPSNDNLRGAKVLRTKWNGSYPYIFDEFENNYGATRQRGEPRVTRYNTVWYKWTPPKDGRVWILVESKVFDEMLSVWTGPQNDIRKLRLQAANDDYWIGPDRVSEVEFRVRKGTPLWIAAGTYYRWREGRFAIEGAYGSLRNP